MTKKGPLSKAERFYIENNLDMKIADLCKDLDRAKSSIEKHIASLPTENVKAETLLYQNFARNDNGATVMTENASMAGDDLRDARLKQSKETTQRPSHCTTTIRPGKKRG